MNPTVCRSLLLASLVLVSCASQDRLFKPPMTNTLSDGRHDTLKFTLGAEYVTRVPLFLVRTVTGNVLTLTEPGMDAPTLDSRPGDREWRKWKVVRLCPTGTRVKLVGLSDSKFAAALEDFIIGHAPERVRIRFFEAHGEGNMAGVCDYNHELFREVDSRIHYVILRGTILPIAGGQRSRANPL
jgi:hypothetical protein